LHTNIKWEDKNGEIDIVLTEKDSINQVIALAECKCSIYDIAAAYRQSGTQRSLKKNKIIIN